MVQLKLNQSILKINVNGFNPFIKRENIFNLAHNTYALMCMWKHGHDIPNVKETS